MLKLQRMELNLAFGEHTSTGNPANPSSEVQPHNNQQHSNWSDTFNITVENNKRDFLQLYSELRTNSYGTPIPKEEGGDPTRLSQDQMDKAKSIILTYRNLKTQYETNTEKYNRYKEDLSKNEVLKTDIMKTKAVFLGMLNTLEPVDEKKKKYEASSKVYDDERIELITNYMSNLESKILELGNKLGTIDEQLCFIRGFFNELLNDVVPVERRMTNLCTICMDTTVNKVIVPCGHTFCSQCVQQAETTTLNRTKKCGICRTQYTQAINLYL